MRKKVIHPRPPVVRRTRKTCEELVHETYEHLQSLDRSCNKEMIFAAVHRFLRGGTPEEIVDFIVQKYFDECRSYYPEFVCTHSVR